MDKGKKLPVKQFSSDEVAELNKMFKNNLKKFDWDMVRLNARVASFDKATLVKEGRKSKKSEIFNPERFNQRSPASTMLDPLVMKRIERRLGRPLTREEAGNGEMVCDGGPWFTVIDGLPFHIPVLKYPHDLQSSSTHSDANKPDTSDAVSTGMGLDEISTGGIHRQLQLEDGVYAPWHWEKSRSIDPETYKQRIASGEIKIPVSKRKHMPSGWETYNFQDYELLRKAKLFKSSVEREIGRLAGKQKLNPEQIAKALVNLSEASVARHIRNLKDRAELRRYHGNYNKHASQARIRLKEYAKSTGRTLESLSTALTG